MGRVTLICVFLVFALLLEDGSSVRKKTREEEEEDKKIAEAVNRTLVEEEEKRKEDEKQAEKKKKKGTDKVRDQDEKKKMGVDSGPGTVKKEDEAPSSNHTGSTCPVCEQCPDSKECRPCSPCERCPECGLCPELQPCPEERTCPEEQPCQPCRPCVPCPVDNTTRINPECPSPPSCTESPGISVPVAMVIGASISLVTMGAAAVVGLILRYVPPLISGILFLSVVFVVWFLSSHHPDVAREMGGRVATILREATVALGHRIMAAIQRYQDQVGFPNPLSNPIF
jgi:hypothetical protein